MIQVIIKYSDIEEQPNIGHYYDIWICNKLKEAGIPIIGGPILPKVDFSKGILSTYTDPETMNKIFIWEPLEKYPQ